MTDLQYPATHRQQTTIETDSRPFAQNEEHEVFEVHAENKNKHLTSKINIKLYKMGLRTSLD